MRSGNRHWLQQNCGQMTGMEVMSWNGGNSKGEKLERGDVSAGQGTEVFREVGGMAGYKKTKPPI